VFIRVRHWAPSWEGCIPCTFSHPNYLSSTLISPSPHIRWSLWSGLFH
jgi:hypothetical protein